MPVKFTKLPCTVEKDVEWYATWCDALNIASQGQTLAEAQRNLAEAIKMWFEDAPVEEVLEYMQFHASDKEFSHHVKRSVNRNQDMLKLLAE